MSRHSVTEGNSNTSHDGGSDDLNERPAIGLRRQPTRYPHGLGITVQTVSNQGLDYSRASTLRSNWDGSTTTEHAFQTEENYHRKYRIGMISNAEHLAELQVRRFKYPLTGNYYLDTQEATKSPLVLLEHAQRFCRWKYLRWPIIFAASVLLFFGLITYCLWLHDVSVVRQRYLQRRFQFSKEQDDNAGLGNKKELPTVPITTESAAHRLESHTSTVLRAVGSRTNRRPADQKLTTSQYAVPKAVLSWNRKRKDPKKVPNLESTTLSAGATDVMPISGVRFTSGHQNSFGVPIEEDQRVLRLINSQLFPPRQLETSTTNVQTKVSPTIPPVSSQIGTTPSITTTHTHAHNNGCYSTSLPMCQGVLEYDLTYNSTIQLDATVDEAYQKLIHSNCSLRASEFICAVLEPECRPLHIGVLPPCRRICKAILEACSVIIANSDVLSATFDCNLYPESNDPHKCEDPTRRTNFCYDNEYECYDRSCIPYQWQCDNIKDCSSGEEEDNCLVCEQHDEFRCRSNEKCISETMRCDLKYDCFDGSDEEDCEDDYGSGESDAGVFDVDILNSFPRIFSYASFLSPNQSNDSLYAYITATTDEESGSKFEVHEVTNRTSNISNEDVTNSVPGDGPKGFVNFRDSKEIMMTSDSENKFKYSAARGNHSSATKSTTTPTTLKAEASQRQAFTLTTTVPKSPTTSCASHELRCVSGKCITVEQLCDRQTDCPDGADELKCVYKERPTTAGNVVGTSTSKSTRADKRTMRTTVRRKVKT